MLYVSDTVQVLHNAKHFAYGTKVLVEDLGKFLARDQASLLR